MPYTSRDLRRYNYLLQETDAVYHEMAQHWGLPDSVMGVLYTLCDAGGRCSVREVCRLGGMSKQTVNSALKKLEKGGTLYLTPGPGRNTRVYLTESGSHGCVNLQPDVAEWAFGWLTVGTPVVVHY